MPDNCWHCHYRILLCYFMLPGLTVTELLLSYVLRTMLFIDFVHCLCISIIFPFCEALFLPYFCGEVLEILFTPCETWKGVELQ